MKKQEELMKINNLIRIIQIRKRRSEKIVLEIECEKNKFNRCEKWQMKVDDEIWSLA